MPHQNQTDPRMKQLSAPTIPSGATLTARTDPNANSVIHIENGFLFLLAAPFLLLMLPFIGMVAMVLTVIAKVTGGKADDPGIWKAAAFVGIPLALVLFIAANINNRGSSSPQRSPHLSSSVSSTPQGQVWVNSYHRTAGTFVPGHYRTSADGDPANNWSSYPDANPYTGKPGSNHSNDRR